MTDERNFGVTEARLGLTLLTCLLVALGIAILQRLGDPEASPVTELQSSQRSDEVASALAIDRVTDDDQPQVLPTQSGDSLTPVVPRLARQPSGLFAERYPDEQQRSNETGSGLKPSADDLFRDPAIAPVPGDSTPR